MKVWKVTNRSRRLDEMEATRVTDRSVFFRRSSTGKEEREALVSYGHRTFKNRDDAVSWVRHLLMSRIRIAEEQIRFDKERLLELDRESSEWPVIIRKSKGGGTYD